MTRFSKTFELNDGQFVSIRTPSEEDVGALTRFLSELPAPDRECLRLDVTEADACRRRLAQLDDTSHFRLVAEIEGQIVGDVTLEREPFAWTSHMAKVCCLTHRGVHDLDVGAILIQEISHMAEDAGIDRLVANVMPEQKHLISTLKQTGFQREATLRGFAKNERGEARDLRVYSIDLGRAWDHLADLLHQMDVRLPGY